MWNVRTLRASGLIAGAVLAGVALFTAQKHALSEPRDGDAVMGAIEYEPHKLYQEPRRLMLRLFPNNNDCAAVKLDVWIARGLMAYSLFANPDSGAPPAGSTDDSGRTTMLIGGKDCRVRVTIERAESPSGGN